MTQIPLLSSKENKEGKIVNMQNQIWPSFIVSDLVYKLQLIF